MAIHNHEQRFVLLETSGNCRFFVKILANLDTETINVVTHNGNRWAFDYFVDAIHKYKAIVEENAGTNAHYTTREQHKLKDGREVLFWCGNFTFSFKYRNSENEQFFDDNRRLCYATDICSAIQALDIVDDVICD